MEVGQIVTGHINELLGLNKNISEARINICKKCPIYSSKLGGICNNRLYINPENEDVSVEKLEGYIQGCGCRLQAKTTILNEHCPINKW